MLRTCESRLLNLRIDTTRNNIVVVLARPSIVHDWVVTNVAPVAQKHKQKLVIACFTRIGCEELYSKFRTRHRFEDVGLVYGLIDPETKNLERRKPIVVTTYHALLTLTRYLGENTHVVLTDLEHMFMSVKTRILFWSILTRLALRQIPVTLVTAYLIDSEGIRKVLSYRKVDMYNLGDISSIGEIVLVKAEYYTESLADRVHELVLQHLGDTILVVCDSKSLLHQFAQTLQRITQQPTYIVTRPSEASRILNRHQSATILATSSILKYRLPIDVAIIVVHSDAVWTEHKLLSAIKDVWTTSRKLYVVYNNRDQGCRRLIEKVIDLDVPDISFPQKQLDTYILYVTYPEMRFDQVVRHVMALPFLKVEPREVHKTVSDVLCRAKLVELDESSDTIRHTRLGQVLVEQCFTVDEFLSIFSTFISTRSPDTGIPDPEKTLMLHVEPLLEKYVDQDRVRKVLTVLRKQGLEPQVDPRLLTALLDVEQEVVMEAYRIAKLLYTLMVVLKYPKRRRYREVFEQFEKKIYRVLNILRNYIGKEIDRELLSSIVAPMLKATA